MNFWYKFLYFLIYPFVKLICPARVEGRENLIDDPAVICANHTSLKDPVMVAFAFGHKRRIFFMSKKELTDIPVLGSILKAICVYPVDRSKIDIAAVKLSMQHLKNGHRIMIFPEGTRVSDRDSGEAKTGAVKIAAKVKCPIIPVYIKASKRFLTPSRLFIGKPYYIDTPPDKNFEPISEKLMDRIYEMEPSE